jgi:branched-chain amino acid transport system permease protein
MMEQEKPKFRSGTILVLLIVSSLALFPWLGHPPVYFISFLFMVFIYVTLATSWNLIGGYAGYLSLGHVAFFGIGAYASAILSKALSLTAVGTVLSSLPAGLIAAAVAIVVGYPCLRLRGPYFAVITLCLAFVVQLAVKNLDFLGGADGLWLKAMDLPIAVSRSIFFELMLVLMVLTISVSFLIGRSRFGAGLRAIKEDEEVAQTMAINAPKLKIQAFALSAFFPGVAGGIYAYYLTYIHPDIVFDVNISILVVLMALFGGGASWLGPVVGSIALTFVNELLSTFVKAELARIIYGCLFIAVIIFMPNGVIEFFRRGREKLSAGV